MPWSCSSMSEISLQCTGLPTSTGTIWLTDGIYVQPINYPTVPKGTERLRFTPTPFHDDGMFDRLVVAMDKLWTHCNVKRMGGVAA